MVMIKLFLKSDLSSLEGALPEVVFFDEAAVLGRHDDLLVADRVVHFGQHVLHFK